MSGFARLRPTSDWLWMELDEFFLYPFAGISVSDQEWLVKFWQDMKEKFEEGPYLRPNARC